MPTPQTYIIIAIAVLIVIGAIIFFKRKDKKKEPIGRLAGFAFGFILAGIIFGNGDWFGYSLIGIGVVLAVVDIVVKLWKK